MITSDKTQRYLALNPGVPVEVIEQSRSLCDAAAQRCDLSVSRLRLARAYLAMQQDDASCNDACLRA